MKIPRHRTGLLQKAIDLRVDVFEWPDRFHVEAETPDRDYYNFFPSAQKEVVPHFVDLSLWQCSCRDYEKNLIPLLVNESPETILTSDCRLTCKHIDACLYYRERNPDQPKGLRFK